MDIEKMIDSGMDINITIKSHDLERFAESIVRRTMNDISKIKREEVYLTPGETAKKLHVDRSTLWRWNKTGYLRHVEVGGKRLYKKSDIDGVLLTYSS